MRLKDEAKEQASLNAEEEARFSDELRLKAEKDDQAHLESEEEKLLVEELRLKAEAGGFCGAEMER